MLLRRRDNCVTNAPLRLPPGRVRLRLPWNQVTMGARLGNVRKEEDDDNRGTELRNEGVYLEERPVDQ